MKPTFALDLTREAIALLHRTPKGWLPIGEVAFDAPDLAETLDYLRKTALGLSPMGMACKLILPNSQILYTEVHAPGPSREDKRRQIAAALEGRTPYPVEDLVFDWSGKGQTVKVAVVARETLQEAEGFATTHRLNPVSFVAIPEAGDFVGEPWFGPSTAAEALLAPGESVDRDREAVVILHRDPPAAEAPQDEAPEDAPVIADADLAPEAAAALAESIADPVPMPEVDDALPGLEEALNADVPLPDLPPVEPPSTVLGVPARMDDGADDVDEDALAAALADPVPAPFANATPWVAPDPAPVSVPSRPEDMAPFADALPPAVASAAPDPGPAPSSPVEVDEAPFAHVPDSVADAEDELAPIGRAVPDVASAATDVPRDDDLPPAPSPAAMVAFASRRAAAGVVVPPVTPAVASAAPSAPAPTPPAPTPTRSVVEDSRRKPAPLSSGPIPRPAPVAASPNPGSTGRVVPASRPAGTPGGVQGLVTAPTIPGTRPVRAKGKAMLADSANVASSGGGPATIKSPSRPGGTFGATAPARNRSGVVLMVMIGLLLLFLAFIAAVSSYFLSQNGSAEPDTAMLGDPVAVVPGVDDEMLADLQDPEGMTEPLPEAEGAPLAAGGAAELATERVDPATAAPLDLPAESDVAEASEEAALPEAAEPVEAAAAPATTTPGAEVALEPAPNTVVDTEVSAAQTPVEDQDEIFLSAMDAPPPALDALALPEPSPVVDSTPLAPMPPPAFGTVYQFDEKGLLVPTPDGILSPEGVMLFAGPPPRVPPARSEVAAAAARAAAAAAPPAPEVGDGAAAPATAADASLVTGATEPDATATVEAEVLPAPADPAMSGFRPRPRPDGLAPAAGDDAALDAAVVSDFASVRPLARPEIVLAAAAATRPADPATDLGAQGASLAAQAEADRAAAAALEAENPSIVSISRRPEPRPRDLSRAVEAAVAAAVREPEPEAVAAAAPPDAKPEEMAELEEPDGSSAAPSIPTKASVAKQATFANAINLSKMNLIGTYGTDSKRTALIRQSNGRYKKVKVGDRIDGGTVMAITEGEVRYQKGGRLLTLSMPKA